MQLIQFKANEIEKIWPLVKDHVQSALDRNQNFRNHTDVKENCINGLEQLWVIVDDKDKIIKTITPQKYKGICFDSLPHYQIFPKHGLRLILVATFI